MVISSTRSLLGVGKCWGGYSPPLPRNGTQWDTVGQRAVRILLECFLVFSIKFNVARFHFKHCLNFDVDRCKFWNYTLTLRAANILLKISMFAFSTSLVPT